jgi:5-methylcytosine-specific restriction endonuclease McrBC GTP-binding regulatory subunit McrB
MLESYPAYVRRVRSMSSQFELPAWLRADPERDVQSLIESGASAILLYGPPRTGKTRCIDALTPRTAAHRATIQIHDGWTYDHLIQGFMPDAEGHWAWKAGALVEAIRSGTKTTIVLEEINRTLLTQALGEVFSLIERDYRGEANAVALRSGELFWIPKNVLILMTMNTVDKSTEEVDDALLGRIAAVEFPPSTPALIAMLEANGVPAPDRAKLAEVHAGILAVYPLGQGYFADLAASPSPLDILRYYKTRIRPVLFASLGELRAQELVGIDNLLNDAYGQP